MNNQKLEKIKNLKCEVKEKIFDDNSYYGTFPDLDEMVDSSNVNDRIRLRL